MFKRWHCVVSQVGFVGGRDPTLDLTKTAWTVRADPHFSSETKSLFSFIRVIKA